MHVLVAELIIYPREHSMHCPVVVVSKHHTQLASTQPKLIRHIYGEYTEKKVKSSLHCEHLSYPMPMHPEQGLEHGSQFPVEVLIKKPVIQLAHDILLL